MFADKTATAMIPAKDVERAKRWYDEKLGLKPAKSEDYGATYEFNGVKAFLYQSQFAGTAQHTLLSFDTADLAGDMTKMREKGVKFEEYDLPDLKTVDGVAEFGPVKNAWAKDSEGNILGFVQGM
jgi:catechol 2,3-dioxygenase-like lactoylglutathione lyase family enzyme